MAIRITTIRELTAAARGRRLELGLSQAQLAERAAISRQWLSEFENGKPTAELGLVMRLLDALDLELSLGERPAGPDSDLDALLRELGER